MCILCARVAMDAGKKTLECAALLVCLPFVAALVADLVPLLAYERHTLQEQWAVCSDPGFTIGSADVAREIQRLASESVPQHFDL